MVFKWNINRDGTVTPKEIVQREFEDTTTPWLESLRFEYVRSLFSYKRKVEQFEQRISVALSHRNSAERIGFWSAFDVASSKYNQWLKTQRRQGYIHGEVIGDDVP